MTRTPPSIGLKGFIALAPRLRRPYQQKYFAMYSSVLGCIVTDPVLMTMPIDDHMAHRGDGVFEVMKCLAGNLYNWQGHAARLARSAQAMALKIPATRRRLRDLVCATIKAGARRDCMVRIYVSRGPGGFSVDPYESPETALYIVVSAAGQSFMLAHPHGARVCSSGMPAKIPTLARVKNCNYIPNVFMRKEAVDRGIDFTVGFDAAGYMTEGATENFGIVTGDRRLLFPHLAHILKGTTMVRVMALARCLVRKGVLRSIGFADIDRHAIASAREFLVTGTTINVVAAVEFDGERVGRGTPGPIYRALHAMLLADMLTNRRLLTPVI